MMTVSLAPQQVTALDLIGEWLKDSSRPLFNLQGYAGTGKTTIAVTAAGLADKRIVFLAPTGKAASVMRRKGCTGAQTIHRAIYTPKIRSTKTLHDLVEQLAKVKTAAERTALQAALKVETLKQKSPSWELRLESELNSAELVVVDEASMVPDHMLDDIQQHGAKVLCLSDPAQLPPVRGTSTLMTRVPDMLLTDVHRQALDSPVLRAATAIRNGRDYKTVTGDGFEVVRSRDTSWDAHYGAVDQVLVAKNKTRKQMNLRFRARLNREGLLCVGERIVFLKNNYDSGIYNGTTGTVTGLGFHDVDEDAVYVDCDTDEGQRDALKVWTGGFTDAEYRFLDEDLVPADYAYALTVHKAQGSEWDKVLVWDEYSQRDRARWLYTAVTRGAKSVTIVEP